MDIFCEISTVEGLKLTYAEWLNYFNTLSLDEIQGLYWSQFDNEARKRFNKYLKKRLINNKKRK